MFKVCTYKNYDRRIIDKMTALILWSVSVDYVPVTGSHDHNGIYGNLCTVEVYGICMKFTIIII